jgi:hypothetical protein
MTYFGLISLISCLFSKFSCCLVLALCSSNILENYNRLIRSIDCLIHCTIK